MIRFSDRGVLTATFAGLLWIAGCGSSGSSNHDGAADGARDGSHDTSSVDARDATGSDADAPIDAGAVDASDGSIDAAPDASDGSASETSSDASTDGLATTDVASSDAADAGSDGVADADPDAGCDAGTAAGSHVTLELDSKNAEWVKSVRWRDSAGTLTDNLTGFGGGPGCTSPYEFFGQAFAAPEGNGPYPVGGDNIAEVTSCGLDQTIVSKSPDCSNAAQIPVTTAYRFYAGAKADQVRITRTIGFDANTPKSTGVGMRVFVPRLLLNAFSNVIFPNGAGTGVNAMSAGSCGNDCFTPVGTSWNGKWFADIDLNSGRAMIVLRDPSMTSPVSLTVNSDGSSATNLSSFVVLQPDAGWKAPITEVEYLCFADLTTWPQSARDAATLPAGCGP